MDIRQDSHIRSQMLEDEEGRTKEEGRSSLFCRLSYVVFRMLILFPVLCLLFSACYAQQWPTDNIKDAFNRANVYYEQGNYDEAIKQYNSVLEGRFESGNLYYNIGNCYFKKGKLGEAILYYEKARRLIPGDKDLEPNYEYARSLIKGSIVVSKKSLFAKATNNLFDKFTIDGVTVFLSVFYMLILFGILIGIFFNPIKKQAFILAVFLGLFFIMGLIGLKSKIDILNKEAIVVAEQADAKFEPMDKATTYFTLYEGMKVEVITSQNNWYKVKREDNKSGWVQGNAVLSF